ncbi:MAG: NAD-dependent epimerase/dehydratase family protein [Acidobacteriota bacterium]
MTRATIAPEPQSIGRPEADDLQRMVERLDGEMVRMAGRRVLITGGAGFLGYYLVRSIVHYNAGARRPIELTVLDNFSRGEPPWLRALESSHVEVMRHDVTRPLPVGLDPAFIVHAASIASPSYYRTYPIETMDANVRGLRHLLDHCMARKDAGRPVESVLFFSSSEIYGDPESEHIPTPETYPGRVSCTGPRACYDESKRYGETLCVNYHQQHGLPIRIVRPFNNYGPGLDIRDRRLLADFARCVLADRDIVMYSDGSPTRTFCYVADAVVGYYRALVRGRAGEAYNIGNEAPEIAVRDVAEKVVSIARDLFGYAGRAIYQTHDEADYLTDNPQRRCPAIAKARAELEFEPEISLDEGLRRSLLWYQRRAAEGEGV